MTAPQNPRVTQADRDAAIKAARFNDEGDLQYWGSNANREEVAALAQAFARHREAAEAASKAREAALVEALERIDLMCPVTCDITVAHEMADIARAALTPKEPDA